MGGRVGVDTLEMCSGSVAGSHSRPVDSRIIQLKAQGSSRTCNKSKEGEEEDAWQKLGALSSLLFPLTIRRHKPNQIISVYCLRYMSWEVLENLY